MINKISRFYHSFTITSHVGAISLFHKSLLLKPFSLGWSESHNHTMKLKISTRQSAVFGHFEVYRLSFLKYCSSSRSKFEGKGSKISWSYRGVRVN